MGRIERKQWVLAAVTALYFHCGGTAQLNICWAFGECGWGLSVLLFWALGQRALDTGLPQGVGSVLSAMSYRSAIAWPKRTGKIEADVGIRCTLDHRMLS